MTPFRELFTFKDFELIDFHQWFDLSFLFSSLYSAIVGRKKCFDQ